MKVSSKGDYQIVPQGTYLSRCFRVIDLGTQVNEIKGHKKQQRKVLVSFELPTELHVFDEKKGEEPFSISNRYTASLSPKATLHKHIKSWRGRDFTPEELEGFELKNLLGKANMLTVVHTNKDGDTFANIEGIAALPKGTDCPAQINKSVYFSMDPDEFNSLGMEKVFAQLHEGLQKVIRRSPEWQKLTGETAPADDEETSSGGDDTTAAAAGKKGEVPW